MKTTLHVLAAFLTLAGHSTVHSQSTSNEPPPPTKTPASTASEDPGDTVIPLDAAQQEKLLASRLPGGMQFSFGDFSNMFLVSSKIHFGTGIALMTPSPEIMDTALQSPFPTSYHPTLREFLDAIALQTLADWKYDPSSKYFENKTESKTPVEGFAVFEFKKKPRKKPFLITLAKGWKSEDMGNWVMHTPPDFPVGMDIYEMGSYSPGKDEDAREFARKIRLAVSMQWAKRVNAKAEKKDLKAVKLGRFDALFYETMTPSQMGEDIKWRQWVFMTDNNKCYFIVSTILPEFEARIFPDVEKMLASFQLAKE